MNAPRLHCFTCTTTILLGCIFLSVKSFADDIGGKPDSENAAPAPPTISFQVLKSRRVNAGDHAIIYNRVAPPVLPEAPAFSAVSNLPAANPPQLSPEMLQMLQRRQKKRYELLFVFATVYDHQVTELRWFGDGVDHRAFSNVDFNYFGGTTEIETDEMVYGLLMGIVNETRKQADAENSFIEEKSLPESLSKQIPPLAKFSPVISQYMLADDKLDAAASDKSLAGIDALHVYFDANKQKLMEDSIKRKTALIAKEKWDKEHPPIPRDTVINFWPGENTIMLDAQSKGRK